MFKLGARMPATQKRDVNLSPRAGAKGRLVGGTRAPGIA
jgi:hypothetical protein